MASLGAQQALGIPNNVVKIATTDALVPRFTQTKAFKDEVFNLIDDPSREYNTHENVFLRDGWAEKTMLLEIENAFFSIEDYVQIRTSETVVRNGKDDQENPFPGQTIQSLIAHSLKATITLEDGGSLAVTQSAGGAPETIAQISGGGYHMITFDNDCEQLNQGRNDMLLYYDNAICGGTQAQPRENERYWVGSNAAPAKGSSRAASPAALDPGIEPNGMEHYEMETNGVEPRDPSGLKKTFSKRSSIAVASVASKTPILRVLPWTGGATLSEGKPCMPVQVKPAGPNFP
ncbi:MAG TPA: hypothetical protein VGO50_08330 [Pyrinomonadaceae bacterium]|nr:hypothetical protein [Pyrinomonadaceae bacterium]